ncbi:MAG: MBL fold metallo-hydrolase [Clostridia bacterium]|nr:MBL fold metallo-hydrolase [Clostridia bacterium]
MRITVLVENTSSNKNFYAEHGLSLYIQTKNKNILFDMGQTDLFYENAKKLGVDIEKTDIAVISHGHYDHGGGLEKFLSINSFAPVYISSFAFNEYYNKDRKYIGLNKSLMNNERLVFTNDIYQIDPQITLCSHNNSIKAFDFDNCGLSEFKDGDYFPDSFRHEQYMLINEDKKRVLISGCSHKGILNITNWFKPDVLIGGFHLSKFPLDEKLKNCAKTLSVTDTDFYTCHCTGIKQFEFMKKYIKNLHYISTGQTIVI